MTPDVPAPDPAARFAHLRTLSTLGDLKAAGYRTRSVKDELRANVAAALRRSRASGEPLFPGILGYDETVVPAVANALLARHDLLLLGLRGQAKTRLVRSLPRFLDPAIPAIAGSEVHDDPFRPFSKAARERLADQGDDTPIVWLERHERYGEKLATPDTTMADRVRMNTLSLATTAFAQTPSFWHAGTELLRSKSLDRNSYNSGDWFNRIDWTGRESTFGSGLPRQSDNAAKWDIMRPLLENPALKPGASDIAKAEASALDLLRVREEVGLLRLGSADLIGQKVTFPGSGPDAAPGVIVMLVDDRVGADVDPALAGALVVFNASPEATTQKVSTLAGRSFSLTPALAKGSDAVVKRTTWDAATGTITVPARSVAVLVEKQRGPKGPKHPHR